MCNQDLEKEYNSIQINLAGQVCLENVTPMEKMKRISGVDLAYWHRDGRDYAVCSIVTFDEETREIIEVKNCTDEITVPYIPGYLSFRELPLILKTYEMLETSPDLVIFDGNGYLHYRNMGIATHASFYLKKPTIGVAKSYLKIDGVDFIMPADQEGAFSDIVIKGKVYGRALRTHEGVKPIFVSCGNWIDLDTATEMVLRLVSKESRQPMVTRRADMETKKMRKLLEKE